MKKNIILLFLVFSIFVFSSCTQKNIDYKSENVNKQGVISKIEDVTKQGIISNIKVVNGVPKIFLDGKEFDVVAAQVYNQTLKYDSNWASQLKKTIDAEKAVGANLVLIHLWWSDLDKSTSRPKNLGDNLDFTYVDEIMDYAQSKDIKIMLLTGMHVFIPEWWKKEEGLKDFPQSASSVCMPKEVGKDRTCIPKELCTTSDITNGYCCNADTEKLMCCDLATSLPDITTNPPKPLKPINNITSNINIFKCNNINSSNLYSSCSSCETDNIGWKYNNTSMGYDKAQKDYGQYLTKVINRYKNHPALLGWQMQLGYSGEDYYGPSYITFQNLGDTLYSGDTGLNTGKMTDYSKVFQNSFKIWLKRKYKTTIKLQDAWKDTNVNFENFKMPLRNEFFIGEKDCPFPDEGHLNFFVKLDDLTKKGKDFYEFRKYMKTKDSKYYSNLFKSLDPKHVLFFNAYDNADEYADKNINGYFLNNRLNAEKSEENYIQALFYAILAGKYNQLGLPAWENIGGISNENQKQLDIMEEAGKAMKCFGYDFGYVADISGTEMPSWKSENAKKVIQNIIAYTPTENCKCGYINNSNTWHGKTMKQLLTMYKITDYAYCANSSISGTTTTTTSIPNQGKCGDGVCDGPETTTTCSQDCKTTTTTTTSTPNQGKCGDGVCDGPETTTTCSQDCKITTTTTTSTPNQGKCGDGVCDSVEKSSGMCNQDCK